jgi:Tol biopolymer transport system component
VPPTGNATGNWAPDSKRIAVIYDVVSVPTLRIVDALTGKSSVVDLGGLRPWDVLWMPPTGDRLLIRAESANGTMDVYTLRPDGTDLKAFGMSQGRTTAGPAYTLSGLVLSPDGGSIAYNSIDAANVQIGARTSVVSHFRVHLMASDGSGDHAVAQPSSPWIQEAWPVYAPDGKSIVVHRWVFKGDAANVPGGVAQGWLAIMPSDGSAPAHDIGPRIDGGEDTALGKIWSPDGSRILLSTENTHEVFSIDPVTGGYEKLPWTSVLPDWQRTPPR